MLIVFLLISTNLRKDKKPLVKWTSSQWRTYTTISILWPIGIICLFLRVIIVPVWPELIKERKI